MTLRADAQRNLDRLLDAAGECFAESGVDASVDEIARRAGVGHGTVFRRFTTKDDSTNNWWVAALTFGVTASPKRRRAEPGGSSAVRPPSPPGRNALMEGSTVAARHGRGVHGRSPKLVRSAQSAGEVRRDVGVEDVLALIRREPLSRRDPPGLRPPVR
jgi:hypothetical protein